MYQCRSLIAKRREINRQKGIAGARAREARRSEETKTTPPLPATLTDDIEITIVRRVNGIALPPQQYLMIHDEGRGMSNQYDTWAINRDNKEYLGLMGKGKVFSIAVRNCVPIARAV